MTTWDFARAVFRWWYITLLGICLTAGAGWLAIQDRSMHFTRMEVVFLVPESWTPNVLGTSPEGLMVAASSVAKMVTGPGKPLKFGAPEVTLMGTGDGREGVWLRVEDLGSQWATDIRSPVIVVDVVAKTPEKVRSLQYEAISQIETELDALQASLNLGSESRIGIRVAPDATTIFRVSGNRIRALAMTGALGGSVTLACIWLLERRRIGIAGTAPGPTH